MVVLTREQLEERLAALHEASLKLVRELRLESALESIINVARDQVGARYAALGVDDEQGNLIRFIPVGLTQEEIEQTGDPPIGRGLIGAIKSERRTIRIPDISADPRYVGFPNHHPDMHSFLGVPIMLGDRLLGQLYLTDKTDNYEFTEADAKVIETLAAYAAVAINNARLYKVLVERDGELTKRNEDLALINQLAAALTGSLEIEQILELTLSKVIEHLGVEAGEIFLREEGRHGLHIALHQGEDDESFWVRDHFKFGEGYIGIVAQSGKPIVSTDLQNEVRYLRPAIIEAGFRCLACIPLSVRDTVVGVMCVATRQERHIDERELDLLMSIGTWAGITIENARLQRQAQRLAVLEERERIGMDLHDGIIQSIYAVGLALDIARDTVDEDPKMAQAKIEQGIEGLNNAIRDIRAYILDLSPRQFRGEDLMSGIKKLIAEFNANSSAHAKIAGPKDGLVTLPTANSTALFHICQEALANIARHASAQQVNLNLWITHNRVILEIIDDGMGFDLGKMTVTLGHGLSNMTTRAHRVGGDVEISSSPGAGTTIMAWVPRRE
jgi:two-component system sensor histidine kinase DevS